MKVAIIGKGTSAIVTALKCIQYGYDVTIFYDPKQSHVKVGESTTPVVAQLVYDVLGLSIHYLSEKKIYSLKSGVKFINWGCGNEFYHHFANNSVACHFETDDFNLFINNFLETNGMVKYIPERIEEYRVVDNEVIVGENKFDHIIICSGWSDSGEYYKPIFESVNSAFLFKTEGMKEPNHTIHEATEHGWRVGLPFTFNNITKNAYMFNRNIDDVAEIKEKFPDAAYIQWTPRYSKKLVQNPYCSYSGNRLLFIEPLHALALHYYIQFAEYICQYLQDRNKFTIEHFNNKYHYEMWTYQLALAYHYNYGSVFDSKFWKQTKDSASRIMSSTINGNEELFVKNINCDIMFKETDYSKIGSFTYRDHVQLYCGMNGHDMQTFFKEVK